MYFPILLWSLVIFASFWGYGEALRRAIKRPEFDDLGWGLTAAWGMGITLAIGGFLMMLSLAKTTVLTGVVLAGVALALYFFAQRLTNTTNPQPASKKSKPQSKKEIRRHSNAVQNSTQDDTSGDSKIDYPAFIGDFILWMLAALAFLSSIAWPYQIDPNDDWIAYLMYPEKILATGTLIDPFSLRRVTALGGQSLLQALIMILGDPENGHLLDRGLGVLLLLGLMFEVTRKTPKRFWFLRFIVIFIAITTSVPRIHTGSHLLGVCLLLGVLITISRLLALSHWNFRDCIPIAIILAGVSTFRPIFAMVGGGALIFYFIWRCSTAPKGRRIDVVMPLFMTGALTFVLLLPYMIVSWISSATPMFPFSSGYANPQMMFGGLKERGWADWVAALHFLCFPEVLVMAIGAVASVLILPIKQKELGCAAALAGLFMVFLSAYKMSAANLYDVYRYTYPLIAFAFFWILSQAIASPLKWNIFTGPRVVSLTAVLFLCVHMPTTARELQMELSSLKYGIEGLKFPVAQLAAPYKQLQDLVPAGEKIFTIVDAPYLLDFKRNPIDNIDSIGGASLPPGMPFEQGPEALKRYFLSLGYRYIICVDFDNAVLLYTRKLWENHPRKEWYFKEVWGRYALDFMGNLDNIAGWHTKAKAGNCRLIEIN